MLVRGQGLGMSFTCLKSMISHTETNAEVVEHQVKQDYQRNWQVDLVTMRLIVVGTRVRHKPNALDGEILRLRFRRITESEFNSS
uniref:Uncharacterized protein n=1 Tax=Arundo donax TaxID=35708 RepID=A0A0A8XMT6_ARUDO